jgi:hypothetical protein
MRKKQMKQYNNGPRKGMMYGGATRRKPMMYGGTATKPRKKAQMGGMMSSNPMMQPQQKQKPTMQPPLSMSMADGGKASLKPVPEDNKGLGKLPKPVRNNMGYMMYGGKAKKRG